MKSDNSGKNSPSAQRAKRLREALGYGGQGGQKAFADFLGVSSKRWNNIERGVTPFSKGIAVAIRRKVSGIDRDWLEEGDPSGLSFSMAQLLGETGGPRKGKTTPS